MPENDRHYFAVYNIDVGDEAKAARAAWAAQKGEVEPKKIFAQFVNEGKAGADDDKKDKDDSKKEKKEEGSDKKDSGKKDD